MQQHLNQNHSVQLTCWASRTNRLYSSTVGQLWRSVKVQTFFREKRYIRYFIVQEQEWEEQEGQEHQ